MKKGIHKRLSLEGLEARQCFSADIGAILADLDVPAEVVELVRHNFEQPTDVNVDGYTSPADALSVINELNFRSTTVNSDMMTDTNGDRRVSPADALIVINYLNDRAASSSSALEESADTTEENGQQIADLVNQTVEDSQASQETAAELLGRLRDLGLIDIGNFDLGSIDFGVVDGSGHAGDMGLLDPASLGAGSLDVGSLDVGSPVVGSVETGTGDAGANETSLLDRGGDFSWTIGRTYDPTNDNGNGYFLSSEDAKPLSDAIEAELRKQLKLDESASITVAVFAKGGEVRSGTWRYLTEEGISIWGNWRQTPEELRLFLSNVEEENRIYGQYPDGSFLYFSWLDDEPVGFFFTPIGTSGVENPVPLERYTQYFARIPGAEAYGSESLGFDAFAGDLTVFDGVQPIENLLSDLFAIQLNWNDELAASRS